LTTVFSESFVNLIIKEGSIKMWAVLVEGDSYHEGAENCILNREDIVD